jgi:hypothetical protein
LLLGLAVTSNVVRTTRHRSPATARGMGRRSLAGTHAGATLRLRMRPLRSSIWNPDERGSGGYDIEPCASGMPNHFYSVRLQSARGWLFATSVTTMRSPS